MVAFYEKVAALRDQRSFAASWLEDFRDSLARIFGLNPAKAWDHMMFNDGIELMLETVKRMEEKVGLHTICRDAYEQAKREWNGSDARAMIQRETNFVRNIPKLDDIRENFEAAMAGLLIENDGAVAHCRNELARLFRMHRLSR
jgi:hypothetical protein